MSECPKVSVVILNYNGEKFVGPCLRSVLKTDYPSFEIIFVDNGSTDKSVEEAIKILGTSSHKIVRIADNIGWSGGNNTGLIHSSGEAAVFLSNDTEVDSRWLKELIKTLYSEKNVGLVQAKSLLIGDRKTLDSGKNFVDVFGFCYSENPRDIPEEVFFAEGVAMAVKKEVFRKIGLFDQDFVIMYDDIDLSWRARLAGYKAMIAPQALVYHHRGGTVGEGILKVKPEIVYLNVRNHLASLLKVYEKKNLWLYLPPVIVAQFFKSLLFLVLHRQAKAAAAVWRGLFSLLKNRRQITEKRATVQKTRVLADREIKKTMVKFSPGLLLNIFRTRKTLAARTLAKRN